MRLICLLIILAVVSGVLAKNNVKSLTESLGQEIIEIGGPDKGLPADLEEEPSAELEDEEEKIVTSTTLLVATKKETKKTTTVVAERRKSKDYSKEEDSKQDEEETRIEKELAEIYKDNADYKGDSSETTVKIAAPNAIEDDTKPIARARPKNFKFQPDLNNKAEIERFRTSVDEISCDRGQKLANPTTISDGSQKVNLGSRFQHSAAVINCFAFITITFFKLSM